MTAPHGLDVMAIEAVHQKKGVFFDLLTSIHNVVTKHE